MTCRLILTALAVAAVVAAPNAYAQSAVPQPAANQAAKQDKRVTAPQTAAPKPNASKPAAKNTGAAPAEQAKQPPAQADAARTGVTPRAGKEVPQIKPSQLGRVPVENGGTFGFSSETKMKMYETPDGSRIRGLDGAMTRSSNPSYFGLSLSVPTTSTFSGPASGLSPPLRD